MLTLALPLPQSSFLHYCKLGYFVLWCLPNICLSTLYSSAHAVSYCTSNVCSPVLLDIGHCCKTSQNIAKHCKTLHCNIAPGSSTVCSARERKTSDTSANPDAIMLLTAFANFPNRPLTLLIQQNNVDFPSSPTDIAARRGIIIYPGGGSSHPTGNLATV